MSTIRNRLILFFVVCLVFMGGLIAIYYQNFFDLKKKVFLIEHFDDLRDTILEMRRYEKNFFMAGDVSSLDEIVFYLFKTEDNFSDLSNHIKDIMGTDWYQRFSDNLADYKRLLQENFSRAKNGLKDFNLDELRQSGKILIAFVEKLIQVKRHRIESVLNRMQILPLAFGGSLIIILTLILWVTHNDILKPLSLMHSATEKAIDGTFGPIAYSTKTDNEVSQCLTAFNKMAIEIEMRQEQLLHSRKMASIGTFTSGIAHELNNPINNISLIAEALVEEGGDLSRAERWALYQDLLGQSERTSEIVKNLLEFSRTDHPHLEDVSLEELVDKTVRLVKNELKLKHIKFFCEVNGRLSYMQVDKNQLQQALLNLILNGIQSMPEGGELKILIALAVTRNEIRIEVADTGHGIPTENLDSIFDPFFTTKKEGEGTGLGLSVTYNIIKKHGGRISVESLPDRGTCFTIFLPVQRDHQVGWTNKRMSERSPAGQRKKI
ncbi:MAG: sensor histidine kinase [Desulfobacterales bacterium]